MDDEVSLPKATLTKLIKECLSGKELRVSGDVISKMVDCCTEFVLMVASQANEVCNAAKKSTITPEHVLEALRQLELAEWLPDVEAALAEFKAETKSAKSAPKSAGMTNEELEEAQAKLFADARARSFPLGSADLARYGSFQPQTSVPFMPLASLPAPGAPVLLTAASMPPGSTASTSALLADRAPAGAAPADRAPAGAAPPAAAKMAAAPAREGGPSANEAMPGKGARESGALEGRGTRDDDAVT